MQKEVPNFKLLYKQNLEHILKLNIMFFSFQHLFQTHCHYNPEEH